ncbi:MAG TPA: glycerol-3-phosphate 1-O-acyltransferase PlsY [Candidatus Cloacimonas sp.]|nr:glycerol-3-phosphate 1-O-acyltransferase PlsY [Candidatus Cloacimonas sp.]
MNFSNFFPWIMLLFAYLWGSIPIGLIAGKIFYHKDIRNEGSGNIGATNALRTFGTVTGLIVLLLDMTKGFIPVILAISLLEKGSPFIALTALFVILGHIFPLYLSFKGGKGVATAAGAFLALTPLSLLTALLTFIIVVAVFRYVSVASICAALVFQLHCFGLLLKAGSADYATLLLVTIVVLMIIAKHKSNLERLLNKTEPKLKFTKKGN